MFLKFTKPSLISESFLILAGISKKGAELLFWALSIHHKKVFSGEAFGTFYSSQSEKLSEIKPPLELSKSEQDWVDIIDSQWPIW